MSLTKSQVDFHQTFPPQANYISKILQLASEDYSGTPSEISKLTGIPLGAQKGKVVPHIYYAKYMGLINFEKKNGEYSLRLSRMGSTVFENDPYILEETTKAICHYNLCDVRDGAPQWSFVFKILNHNIGSVTSSKFVQDKVKEYFGFDVKLGVVKSSYIGGMFEDLALLEWESNLTFLKRDMKYSLVNVYAYTLLDTWEKYRNGSNELTIDDITNQLKWGNIFGFDSDAVMVILNELEELGVVRINRQLLPETIMKLMDSEEYRIAIYDF